MLTLLSPLLQTINHTMRQAFRVNALGRHDRRRHYPRIAATLTPLLLLTVSLLLFTGTHAQQQSTNEQQPITDQLSDPIRNYDCNYYDDTCIIDWQMDGTWDAKIDLHGCRGQDCWDCDPCSVWDKTSCQQCTASADCVWCPGDGLCRSQALGPSFWDTLTWNTQPSRMTACPQESEWHASAEACQAHAVKDGHVFGDPLYAAMTWSYDLINVEQVWRQNITGQGVHVRVNDVGLDATHPELVDRMDATKNCPNFQSDPSPVTGLHGTAVASIVAAQADNDHCAVGIAPGVTLSACTYAENATEPELMDMLASQLEAHVDISWNAWGPEVCTNLNFVTRHRHRHRHRRRWLESNNNNAADCLFDPTHPASPCQVCDAASFIVLQDDTPDNDGSYVACMTAIDDYCTYHYAEDALACAEFLDVYVSCEYHSLPPEAHQVLVQGVLEGRNGKGIIYVFAGGNSYDVGGVTNTDGFVNSRLTIGVGAVDKEGKHASYSVRLLLECVCICLERVKCLGFLSVLVFVSVYVPLTHIVCLWERVDDGIRPSRDGTWRGLWPSHQ